MKLDELSEETITHIISFLPPKEIKNTKFVSSLFHKLSNDNLLWEKQLKKYFPHHYPSVVKYDKSVQFETMFDTVMEHDYMLTKKSGCVSYEYIPFSKQEIDLFNYAKTGNSDLFSEIFKSYTASLDKLEYLLLQLLDQTKRSFIHWAGYFGNQKILDITFKEISKFFSYDNSSNYDKKLFDINYLSFAAMCNQINIFQGVPHKESKIIEDKGFNILLYAISCCHTNLTRYLINERGLDITQAIEHPQMNKPIYYVAAYGNSETLQLVFESKITRDDVKSMCEASIIYHNSVALEYLLSQSFNTNIPHESNDIMISSLKDSALKKSVCFKRFLLIIMLLKDQNCKANCALAGHGYYNIYISTAKINFTLAERLFHSVKNQYLDKNSLYNISKKDEFGNTIFHWLAYCNQIEILSSLSKQLGNNPNSKEITPIELAAICGHSDVVKIYLEAGLNINDRYYYDETLLLIACKHGHEDLIRYLISFENTDVNLVNRNHSTPLREACEKGYLNIASILLDAGADVNISNLFGATPLIDAAENGHTEILRILLNRSEIDTNKQVFHSWLTALDYAEKNGHEQCILLLQAHNKSQNSHIFLKSNRY